MASWVIAGIKLASSGDIFNSLGQSLTQEHLSNQFEEGVPP